eukprot:TRINITY_DN5016_c0_g3_i1.p1 TRINITY_DN5016_c0_g3~~TRINITY_DN5016_c0_g3_i1.p1  ORF type:complete len:424 (+),score=36.74 TRINITY_DN5016_c0_g3_i1:71-1342(+)
MSSESGCNDKVKLRESALASDLATNDSDRINSADSAHDMSSDSSDSDADVQRVLDDHAVRIKAPDAEKPARRRPWGSIGAPCVKPQIQSEEKQASGYPSSSADGQEHSAKVVVPYQIRVVDTSKFVSAPVKPASHEHSREVSVTADMEVQKPSPRRVHAQRDADESMSKHEPVQKRLGAQRFTSAPSELESQKRSKLPALTPDTSKHETLRAARPCSYSCSEASRDGSSSNAESRSPRKTRDCARYADRQARHVGRSTLELGRDSSRSCSKASRDGSTTEDGSRSPRKPGLCSQQVDRSNSPCPVFSRHDDRKGSGKQYNTVQFNATPYLSTSHNPVKPSSASRSSRTKQEDVKEAAPQLSISDEEAKTQMMIELFRGMSKREVRESLKGLYSSDDIACVLEALSSRAPKAEKSHSTRHRSSV